MAINFPNSPSNGDTHIVNNITYTYDAAKDIWNISDQTAVTANLSSVGTDILPNATNTYNLGSDSLRWNDLYLNGNSLFLGEATISSTGTAVNLPAGSTVAGTAIDSGGGGGGSGVEMLADMAALIAKTGMSAGDQAFVTANNTLYIYIGTGWYKIATVENLSPTAITGVNAVYNLATDGTPTVITATSTDPEGFPLTWSYAVTSGSLGTTATVSQADNVFTITPGTSDPADEGTFEITFSVTDGTNGAVSTASTFTLVFTVSRYTIDTTTTAAGTKDLVAVDLTAPTSYSYGTAPRGVHYGDGGNKLFALRPDAANGGVAYVVEYSLTTPYDVTTAINPVVRGPLQLTTATNPRGFSLSKNGDYCYIACGTNGVVAFQLSTPWNFGTASYWYSHSLTTTYIPDIEISMDGTNALYEVDGVFRTVTMSTPYDLRTSTDDSGTFSNNAFDNNPRGFQFDKTGTKLTYLQNQTTLAVATFASPWTLTDPPVSLVTYSLSGGAPGIAEFDIGPDGYMVGDSYSDSTFRVYRVSGIVTE